jgi:hypothetical protein
MGKGEFIILDAINIAQAAVTNSTKSPVHSFLAINIPFKDKLNNTIISEGNRDFKLI